MSLSTGARLGPYEVIALVGAGGMGEVYRAVDTNLKRQVAIKVLPASIANDTDRLARFQREAELLAALNHPHIAQIYGLEKSDGTTALVMEFVDGPTLAERIARGALPLDEALIIAKQIADALESAHEQGIVHRDLKPANIKLRPDGAVKVVDFGLAKATEPAGTNPPTLSHSPTMTSPAMTRGGVILGTAAYMSPEQARGLRVDKRTDVWAFGCVLFEMLTATAAFTGDTVTDVLARVLHSAPNWSALPPVAAPYRSILERCLEKDVSRRLRDIGDVALLLDEAVGSQSQPTAAPVKAVMRPWMMTAAVVVGLILGGAAIAVVDRSRVPAIATGFGKFQLASPSGAPFDADPRGRNIAISPDGSTMVYTSSRGGAIGLVVRRFSDLEPRRLASTEGGQNPILSPDGKEAAFSTITELKRASVDGGPSTTICPLNAYFTGASWGPRDTIVYADFSFGLFRVSASGGVPVKIASPDATKQETGFASPFVLPDGQTVLYTVVMSDGSMRIAERRLDRDAATTLVEDGFGPQYLSQGYLVFARGDRLMAVQFDPATAQVKGSPTEVETGVLNKSADHVANVAIAANGTAAYVLGHDAGRFNRIVWADRRGIRGGALTTDPVEFPRNLRVSPDGRRLVLTIGPSSNGQIWIYDLSGATQPVKLTFRDHGLFPVWSPDSMRIGFEWRTTPANNLSWVAADGTSVQPETLPSDEPSLVVPLDWSPDGAYLLYQIQRATEQVNVLNLREGKVHPWLQTAFSTVGGRLSPDGRWLAYASNQTGALELWVRPFPGPGTPVRISSNGGRKPMWSRDGKEIFFENGSQVFSTHVIDQRSDFRTEPPQQLFEGGFSRDDADPTIRFMDVAPDGRFLMVEAPNTSASIVVASHWDEELKRLVR